jgi:hypothetical protein
MTSLHPIARVLLAVGLGMPLLAIILAAVPPMPPAAPLSGRTTNVTLQWGATPDADGYKLFWGGGEGYTNCIDVGDQTNASIGGLHIGTRYHFAVSAYREIAGSVYLSSMFLVSHQDWGVLGFDCAAHAEDQETGQPLQIGDTTFQRGLGTHANGEITIPLGGNYTAFDSLVGLQPCNRAGSVEFQVWVDGEQCFASGIIGPMDLIPVHVDVTGAQELKLVVTDAGIDGNLCDMANWAEARLTRRVALREETGFSEPAYFGPGPTTNWVEVGIALQSAPAANGPWHDQTNVWLIHTVGPIGSEFYRARPTIREGRE